MRRILSFALATLALSALPEPAAAKDRGCGNRLATVYETERAFELALQRQQGVNEARAAFLRAREKALEENCLGGSQWDRNTKYDYDSLYREGYAPGSGSSYSDRDRDRDRYSDRRDERRYAERRRFDELLDTGLRRGLNRNEFRELEDLRRKLGL